MRAIRGAEIALIFQEPMTSFSPVHTIGNQIIEMTQYHWRFGRQQARAHAVEMLRRVGMSRRSSASTSTPISSAAACASAR